METGYKNTGDKNISVISTFSLETFLYFPISILPVIKTFLIGIWMESKMVQISSIKNVI